MKNIILILCFLSLNLSAQITVNGNNFTYLTDARNYVRTINDAMTSNIIVNISPGTYTLTETLEFTHEDSGTNDYNIIYQAADPNNKPIISGGQQITGWTLHDASKNIWKANIGSLYSRQLYVNGERAIRARSKDNFNLYETKTGYFSTCTNFSDWENVKDMEIVSNHKWKHYRIPVESACNNFININSTTWEFIHRSGWDPNPLTNYNVWESAKVIWIENNYKLIDNENEWYIDRANDCIYYKPFNGNNPNNLNIVLPKLEKLIVSNKPNDVNNSNYLEKSVSNIVFNNLIFKYTTWNKPSINNLSTNSNYGFITNQADAIVYNNTYEIVPAAVSFYYGNNIKILNNEFRHIGSTGLNFLEGSKNNIICSNIFEEISGSAIHIGDIFNFGDPCLNPDIPLNFEDQGTNDFYVYCRDNELHNYLTVDNNNIYNNFINKIGIEYYNSVGIFISYARNTKVKNNTLSDFPYTGISIGWGWGSRFYHGNNNEILNNKVDCTKQILGDSGGIYTLSSLGDSLQKCKISDNYILNQKFYSAAIYLDRGSSYIDVYNNLIDIYNDPDIIPLTEPTITIPKYIDCVPNGLSLYDINGFIIPNTNNAYVRSIMCYYEAINNYIYSNYYNERYGEFLDPSNCIEIDSENSCQNVVYGINYEFTGFNTHNQQQIIQNSGISSSNNCN